MHASYTFPAGSLTTLSWYAPANAGARRALDEYEVEVSHEDLLAVPGATKPSTRFAGHVKRHHAARSGRSRLSHHH
jgi:hypothetical protein